MKIYCNPPDQIPDHRNINLLLLHPALASSDPVPDVKLLVAAGTTFVEEINLPNHSHLMALRHPWGLALLLCKRTNALI